MRTRVCIREIEIPHTPVASVSNTCCHACCDDNNNSSTDEDEAQQCTCNSSKAPRSINARDDHCSVLVPSYHCKSNSNKLSTTTLASDLASLDGKLITFGGMCSAAQQSFKVYGDLIEYNLRDNICNSIEHRGTCPSPRYKASASYDQLRNLSMLKTKML